MGLIGMGRIREFVETVILTGNLKEHAPVSACLISPPESGKTSVVLAKKCKGVMVLTDVTARGVQKLCSQQPEITHFVLNDLMAVSGKKSHVMHATISMLGAMMEEGIRAVAYPDGTQVFDHGKRGLIACMTPQMANDGRSWWNKTGFSSRLLPFNFIHSQELMDYIHVSLERGTTRNTWVDSHGQIQEFLLPVKMNVNVPPNFARMIKQMAVKLGGNLKEQGYRRHVQLRALACAHALYRNWKAKEVNKDDFEFLEWLSPFVSFKIGRELGISGTAKNGKAKKN